LEMLKSCLLASLQDLSWILLHKWNTCLTCREDRASALNAHHPEKSQAYHVETRASFSPRVSRGEFVQVADGSVMLVLQDKLQRFKHNIVDCRAHLYSDKQIVSLRDCRSSSGDWQFHTVHVTVKVWHTCEIPLHLLGISIATIEGHCWIDIV